MVVLRIGYFVPRILLRLYMLVGDVSRSKQRYVITEKTNLIEVANF